MSWLYENSVPVVDSRFVQEELGSGLLTSITVRTALVDVWLKNSKELGIHTKSSGLILNSHAMRLMT